MLLREWQFGDKLDQRRKRYIRGNNMKLYDLIVSRRTIREFQDKPVARDLLERLVNAGRLAPQAANRQPLEFIVVDEPDICSQIFPLVKLAGYLEWKPSNEKRSRAYIAVIVNRSLQKPIWIPYDVALASENISLVAWEEGIGSCLIGSFNKGPLVELLGVPDDYDLNLLIALGYPAHKSVAEEMKDENIAYRRDDAGTFHVPKRPLNKIIHYNKF